ncbi:MAG: archaeosortase A [Methanomicrobium sp.]|nr:archaeosortase A [Methanomicrobium sp.]MBQ4415651.1 archaeosortase A [Methanomicrobium sp.]
MSEVFLPLIASLLCFILFLAPTGLKKYFSAGGWIFLTLVFLSVSFSHIPENEFVYPILALIALPFVALTVKGALESNPIVFQLSAVAAIAFTIYALLVFVEPAANFMIAAQVKSTAAALNAIGHTTSIYAWDTMMSGGYFVQITVSCTPVVGAAVMLGLAIGPAGTPLQKFAGAVYAIVSLIVINLLRLVFVVIAYSDQWFPFFAEVVSGGFAGFESFYWAHNVMARILFSAIAIAVTGGGLMLIIPDLKKFYIDSLKYYYYGLKETKTAIVSTLNSALKSEKTE